MDRKITDLEKVKDIAIAMLYIEPKPVEECPMFLTHPFFSSPLVVSLDNKLINIIEDEAGFYKITKEYEELFKTFDSASRFFFIIRKQYRLTLFKYVNEYLSEEDFKDMLLYSWESSEYPYLDINVTKSEIIKWFKKLKYKANFSDPVTIYRGVKDKKGKEGLSWTLSIDKARWFATRFNSNGIIYFAEVKNEDILYYIDGNEDEIIIDPHKINIKETTTNFI